MLAFPDFKLPFIFTIDASTVGLGAVLSQVQEETERPVLFASRQLNRPERAYLASELESLGSFMGYKVLQMLFIWETFFIKDKPCSPQVPM
jgi:hypothetical protein